MKKTLKYFVTSICLAVSLLGITMLTGCGESKAKIEVSTKFKTEYFLNENLDVLGGKLTYTDEAGKELIVPMGSDLVTGFDSSTYGRKELTIIYKGVSIKVDYVVYNLELGTYDEEEMITYNKTTGQQVSTTDGMGGYITFNNNQTVDYAPQGSSGATNTYEFDIDIDGNFLLIVSDQRVEGYYEDGSIYLKVREDDETETYSVYVAR